MTRATPVRWSTARDVITVSVPLLLGMVGNLVMMLVDRITLARYSPETLEASGPAVFTAMTIIAFCTMTVAISRSYVAQAHGRGDGAGALTEAARGTVVGLAVAVLLLLTAPLAALIPQLSSRPDEVTELESVYLVWAMRFGAVMVINTCLSSYFNGLGRTRVQMAVGLTGQAVDVFFTVGLVFGTFGLPELGMSGSAIGTLIGTSVMLVLYLVMMPSGFIPALARALRPDRAELRRLGTRLRRGAPSGGSAGVDELAQTAFVWIAALLGPAALAANNVALSINYVGIIPLIGLGIGCSILCANALGDDAHDRVPHIVRVTVGIAAVYVAVISAVQILTPSLLLGPFGLAGGDRETVDTAVATTRVLWTYSVTFMFSMIGSAVLEAFGLTRYVFTARLVVMWLFSVPAILAVSLLNDGDGDFLVVIWLIGSVFEGTLGALFFRRLRRATAERENLLAESFVPAAPDPAGGAPIAAQVPVAVVDETPAGATGGTVDGTHRLTPDGTTRTEGS